MSMVLEAAIPTLIPFEATQASRFTIFCLTDSAVFSLNYPQPPLHLPQYHITPSKLTREALESSIKSESKIDTLLQGHLLVLTTLPQGPVSINNVKIKDWDIYNDGQVIVHGIEEFFDPAFQTVEYPWFDDLVVKKDENNNIWTQVKEILNGNTEIEVKTIFCVFVLGFLSAAMACFCLGQSLLAWLNYP